jgi:hypothetical protein
MCGVEVPRIQNPFAITAITILRTRYKLDLPPPASEQVCTSVQLFKSERAGSVAIVAANVLAGFLLNPLHGLFPRRPERSTRRLLPRSNRGIALPSPPQFQEDSPRVWLVSCHCCFWCVSQSLQRRNKRSAWTRAVTPLIAIRKATGGALIQDSVSVPVAPHQRLRSRAPRTRRFSRLYERAPASPRLTSSNINPRWQMDSTW